VIVFEEVRSHAGTDAAQIYGGLMGQVEVLGETKKIPYEGVPVGTIKKHATGKGNANKLMMITAMQALGHNPVDDNEADALALLRWAIERY
jgi:Holliday junction resolvasome RuvABC endonuclease subunit